MGTLRLRRFAIVVVATAIHAASCTATTEPTSTPTTTVATPTSIEQSTTTTTESATTQASLVFVGGRVITMDTSAPVAEALAVLDNEIMAIGTRDEIEAHVGPDTLKIDLGGRALLPGFVDAHSHYFGSSGSVGADAEAIQDLIRENGVTTMGELFSTPEQLDHLAELDAEGKIRVRTSLYLVHNDACGNDTGTAVTEIRQTRGRGERLRIGGIKIFTDGGSCNAPAVSYEHGFGGNGDLYYDATGLTEVVRRYDEAGHQVAIHAIGDRAIDVALLALDEVIGESGNPLRHRIDHNAVVPPEMRDRYDKTGAVAVVFGEFGACALAGLDPRFQFTAGEPDWEWPWRDLIDLNPNTIFAWHGDWPVFENSSPIASLYGLVTRRQVLQDGTECEPSPYHATQAITVDEALRLMTMGAAYALDRDQEVGSLEVGKLADLVVLSDDPTTMDSADLLDLKVELTVLDGEPLFCTPEFAGDHPGFCP